MESLTREYASDAAGVTFGVAPHSIRAVPLDDLNEIAAWTRSHDLPLHMHVAEQVAENAACVREYGCTPVQLLHSNGLLSKKFTAVHAIHIGEDEIAQLADAGATICSCPTTERNLGDGIVAADRAMQAGIPIALGSDSQAQIDPLEDARELDYHLRLRDQQRAVLDGIHDAPIAERLFACATKNGARALSLNTGDFQPGLQADACTVDLEDLSIAGNSASDLLPILVFSLDRTAIVDVLVDGSLVVKDRKHALHREIVSRYREVHARVWGESKP
jgi:formimidoylglutamate deiminase